MSLDSLMTRTATITRRTQSGTPDATNVPTWEETSASVKCYLEQGNRSGPTSSEITAGRTTEIADAFAIVPPGTPVDGTDRITVDGVRYEVIGPPWPVERPGQGTHHLELNLRALT